MESRQHRAAWMAATVAGVLLPFAPAVVGLRTLSQRDTDLLYAPVRTLVVEALRAGRLPLWNPYEGAGKPLFAEGIHAVLHPVSLAAAALAPARIDVLILAYLVAAALGAFTLARTLRTSSAAAAGAGLGFALSGYAVSMTGNLVFLAGLSTLPWLVAAARAAGTGSRWGAVAVALATACIFLSGDAQAGAVGLGLGALLAADAGGGRGCARALLGMAAGFLLAGVQILPSAALVPLSTRSLPIPAAEWSQWALAPGRLLEWLVPGLFRGPLHEVPRTMSGAWLEPEFAESVHLGAPLLVAAALGWRARRRTGAVLGVAVMVLTWLALGHHLGARQLLDGIPIWSRFRFSEKLMAPLSLCVAALGALGIDAFGAARLPRRAARGLAAAGALATVGLLALAAAAPTAAALAERAFGPAGSFHASTLAAGLPYVIVAVVAVLASDRLGPPPLRAAALALLVALASAAATPFGAHLGDPAVRRLATTLPLTTGAPPPRLAQVGELAYTRIDRYGAVDGFARIESLLLGSAIPVAHKIDTMEPYGAFEPLRFATLSRSLGDDRAVILRRFAVTHAVVQLPPGAWYAPAVDGGRLVQRDLAIPGELWEVPHRPWAFFAERAVAARTTDDARRLVLDLVARGDDGTVVVEAADPPPTAAGRVLSLERGTERVRVEAESVAPALLVVQDAYWPGWRATVDGRPAELLAADALVRAVRWPAGRHRLELSYEPPELRLGLAVSAAGGALVLLLAARAWRRRSPAAVR